MYNFANIMERAEIINRNILSEVSFFFSRSGGAGGQNVNKVNTKVELRWNVEKSTKLTNKEKNLISSKCKSQINNESELIITSQETRSQLKNREICTEKFFQLIEKCTKPIKKRMKTERSFASIEKRLLKKAIKGDLKTNRTHRINLEE